MSEVLTTPATRNPSSRNLSGSLPSMLLLLPVEAGASKAAELDAELLACCAEAEVINARSAAICDAVEHLPSTDPRWDQAYEEARGMAQSYHATVARAAVLPARTPEGLQAKAGLVFLYLEHGNDPEIALSLARDLMGRA